MFSSVFYYLIKCFNKNMEQKNLKNISLTKLNSLNAFNKIEYEN